MFHLVTGRLLDSDGDRDTFEAGVCARSKHDAEQYIVKSFTGWRGYASCVVEKVTSWDRKCDGWCTGDVLRYS